jgi:hypothetical protein
MRRLVKEGREVKIKEKNKTAQLIPFSTETSPLLHDSDMLQESSSAVRE